MILRFLCSTGLVVATIVGSVDSARGGFVYSNGPINGTINGIGIGSGLPSPISNSFTVGTATTLSSVSNAGIWVLIGDTPVSIDWAIGTTGGGSEISSGTSSFSSTFFGTTSFGYDVFDSSFAISGNVDVGTYFLTLSNGFANSSSTMFWDINFGPSFLPGGGDSSSFQINDISAVPEPATMSLMGLGFACMALARRRYGKKPVV